jgi:peptidoglycan/LPS O-acetylase OafA/YrhL
VRVSSLDGLRAIAALSIVVLHADAFATRTGGKDVLGDLGAFAVEMFFVLSGFVLTREWVSKPETRSRFGWRRFSRLAPAYVLVSGVTMAVTAAQGTLTSRAVWHELTLTQFATSQAGLAMPQAWTLGLEVCFYALLPVVLAQVLHLRTEQQVGALAGLAALGLALRPLADLAGQEDRLTHVLLVPDHLVFFLAGMGLALVVPALGRSGPAGLLAAGIGGLWLLALQQGADGLPLQVDLAVRAVIVTALVWAAPTTGPVLAWLGVVSYPIYLWHWVVLRVLVRNAGFGSASAVVLGVVAVAVVVALAAATHRWVEVPGQRWLRARRPQVPAVA